MRRFFVEDIDGTSRLAHIRGDEFIHLKKVLRLTVDSEVALFNGRGVELTGRIDSLDKDSAVIRVIGRTEARKESPLELVLLQGLLKGDKPELVIRKATELGVMEVAFYTTSRTVPLIDEAREDKRKLRWRKAAIEAAKQCGRAALPEIPSITGLMGAVSGRDDFLKLLFWEGEKREPLKESLKRRPAHSGVVVLIGPEGGLSEEEANVAVSAGFNPVGLGPRILKAETAAIAALTVIQYELGDLG